MENLFGIWKDGRPLNATETYVVWEHAKNILIGKGFKSITNEDGFDLKYTFNQPIIGVIPTNSGIVICTTDNNTSSIYLRTETTTTVVFENEDLGFTLEHPIEGIFKYNNQQELIVVLTDNYNNIKYFNITDIINNPPISYISAQYDLFLNITKTTIEEKVITGGTLTSGAYSVFCTYLTADNRETNTILINSPIFITDDSISDAIIDNDGVEADTHTDKAIFYTIYPSSNNIIIFTKVKIGVISTINGVKRAFYVATVDLNAITNYVFTGSETLIEVPLNDVLTPTITYKTAKTITNLNDKIYIGNLTTEKYDDFQKYVNNFKVQWYGKVIDPFKYTDSSKVEAGNNDTKSFMPREVYALYFWFKDLKGNLSKFYHIPGREVTAGDRAISTLPNTGFTTNPPKFQIEDTCTLISASGGPLQTGLGTMGAWENDTEFYETNSDTEIWDGTGQIGNLSGVKVRHHRFPSIGFLSNNLSQTNEVIGFNVDVALGIKIDDLYFPPHIKDNMSSWGIAYAKRDINNMTVYGQDLLLYASEVTAPTSDMAKYTSVGLNTNGDYSFDAPATARVINLTNKYHRGHSPDLLLDQPQIIPTYMANEIQLKCDYLALGIDFYLFDPSISFNAVSPNFRYHTNPVINLSGKVIHSSLPFQASRIVPADSLKIRTIKDFKYYPNDVTFEVGTDKYTNLYKESFIHYELDNPSDLLRDTLAAQNGGTAIKDDGVGATPPHLLKEHQTSRISYCKVLSNIYSAYNTAKNLITIDDTQTPFEDPVIMFGGDVFVSANTITTHRGNFLDLIAASKTFIDSRMDGVFIPKPALDVAMKHFASNVFFITSLHTTNNWGFRHTEDGNDLTQYYPKNDLSLTLNTRDKNNGELDWLVAYNRDYSSVNDYIQGVIENFDTIQNEDYPYTIHLGNYNANVEFLANNFYDMLNKNHGEIWKLVSFKNALLIHQKYALYIARIKDTLITNVDIIYVGQGDVFDRAPDEAASDVAGYAGNQSQWASIVCKYGYCFIDILLGKIFLFNGQLEEISNSGLHNYFRDTLGQNYGDIDNPFTGEGLTMLFDEKYERLVITKTCYTFKNEYVLVEDITQPVGTQEGDVIKWKGQYYQVASGTPTETYHTPNFEGDPSGNFYGIPIFPTNSAFFANHSFTFSYAFDLKKGGGGWVCEHDYIPNHLFSTREKQYAVLNKDNKGYLFALNAANKPGKYFEQNNIFPTNLIHKSYIDFIANVQKDTDKYTHAISWDTDVINSFGKVLENKTITSIMVYNNNQCTGEVDLTTGTFIGHNARNLSGEWSFDKVRDLVKDSNLIFIDEKRNLVDTNLTKKKAFFDKSLFMSKFVIVRFTYNNVDAYNIFINSFKVYFAKIKK